MYLTALSLFDSFLLMTQFWLGSPRLIPELPREEGMEDGPALLDESGAGFVYSRQLHSGAVGSRLSRVGNKLSGLAESVCRSAARRE